MSFVLSDFEWRRVWLLIRGALVQDWRKLAPGAACYALVFVAVTTFLPAGGLLFRIALGLGLVYTAGAFAEVHDKLAAPLALLLPASTSEKIVARWLLGAVAYPIVMLAGTLLLHQAAYLLRTDIVDPWLRSSGAFQMTVNGRPVDLTGRDWTLFPVPPLPLLLFYLWLQPLFLWGGLRFAFAPTMRTLLVLGGGAVIYWLSLMLLHQGVVIGADAISHGAWDVEAVFGELMAGLRVAGWVLLPSLSLLFSYRRLRGAQG